MVERPAPVAASRAGRPPDGWLLPSAFVLLGGLVVFLAVAHPVAATHFRGGTLHAEPTGNGNEVMFTGTIAFRRDFFPGPPAVGDIFASDAIDTGDGGSLTFYLRAIEVNGPQNWVRGEVVDINGDPLLYGGYPSPTAPGGAPWVANWHSAARLSNNSPNHHINNPDADWVLETTVDTTNHPPQADVPPIAFCPTNSLCRIDVPVTDQDPGDVVSIRFSTGAEATGGTFNHAGTVYGASGACPTPLTTATLAASQVCLLGTNSFGVAQLVWNTQGAGLAQPEPAQRTYYSEQIMLEDHAGALANPVRSKTPVDFLIRLTDLPLPRWTDPAPCPANAAYVGGHLTVQAGASLSFTVQAESDAVGTTTADPARPMELFVVGATPAAMSVGSVQGPDASPTGYAPNPIWVDVTFSPPPSSPPATVTIEFYTQDIQDGIAAVANCIVTIDVVVPIPTAQDGAGSTPEDTAYGASVAASGGNGNALTYHVLGQPTHGTLSLNAATGSFTYTPDPNYHGPDSFTFEATDGAQTSAVATYTIQVLSVNDPPVAGDAAYTMLEDGTLNLGLSATDADGDALTFAGPVGFAQGTLTVGPAATFHYSPPHDFTGVVTFTFTANDGQAASNVGTITITVLPVNDAPVAFDETLTTPEDAVLLDDMGATDADADALTFHVLSNPLHGALSGMVGAAFTYTPAPDFFGSDSFTFDASDAAGPSNVATITIQVVAQNDAPLANDAAFTTPEDTPLTQTMTGSDVDGDPLTFLVTSQPLHGMLSNLAGAQFTYTPNQDFFGPDSFSFTASDGSLASAPATITLTVTPVNDPPVAVAQTVTTLEDHAVAPTLLASDVDGDALTVVLTNAPLRGSAGATAGVLVYTPYADRCDDPGADGLTYHVADPAGLSSADVVLTLHVVCVNDAPSAFPANPPITVLEDSGPTTLTIATGLEPATGTAYGQADEAGQWLRAGVTVSNPALFSALAITPATFTAAPMTVQLSFQPAPDACGAATLVLAAVDDAGTANGGIDHGASSALTVTVTCVNDAPVAAPDHVIAYCSHTKTIAAPGVLANDVDVDDDSLEAVLTGTAPAGFFFLPSDGSLSYTPNAIESPCPVGIVTTTYDAVDAAGATSSAVLTLDIRQNHAPIPDFTANPWVEVEHGCIQFTNLSTDPDTDPSLGLGIVRYRWEFADGQTSPIVHPLHCFEHAGQYSVRLIVEDDAGDQRSVQRTVTILYVPAPDARDTPGGIPTGHEAPGALHVTAGPSAFVNAGQHQRLHAAITGGRGPFAVSWTQVAGVPVVVDDDASADPTVVLPDNLGQEAFVLRVEVRDADGLVASDTVELGLSSPGGPPELEPLGVVSAFDGNEVHLDASGARDPDGDALRFQWRQTGGQPVFLIDATQSTPRFVAPAHPYTRSLQFEVEVSDGNNIVVRYVTVQLLHHEAAAASTQTVEPNPLAAPAGPDGASAHPSDVAADGSAAGSAFPWMWLFLGAGLAVVALGAALILRASGQSPKP